jgi:hypothetical protein
MAAVASDDPLIVPNSAQPRAHGAEQGRGDAGTGGEIAHHQEQRNDGEVERAESPVHLELEEAQERTRAGDRDVSGHPDREHGNADRNPQRDDYEERAKPDDADCEITHGITLP